MKKKVLALLLSLAMLLALAACGGNNNGGSGGNADGQPSDSGAQEPTGGDTGTERKSIKVGLLCIGD